MRLVVVLLFIISFVFGEYFNYDGYKVYRVQPSNNDQFKALIAFNRDNRFDFWSPLRSVGKSVDVMVEPSAQRNFLLIITALDIPYTTLIDNVEAVFNRERIAQTLASPEGRISFTKYHRHSEINAYLDQLAAEYPNLATVETIGKSYEGRDLNVIKISTDASANKPVIFVDAAIHAREWATPALATYIVHQLVENAENSALLEKIDWHVLPVVNADGYEYTHTNQRLWRKTRSEGKVCYGVDGNRNFGYHWGVVGASSDECSNSYKGPTPFSEPEAQAVRDHILRNQNRIKMYLTLHTYGEYILYPWGYTSDLPKDVEELHTLGTAARDAILTVYGTNFTVGSSTNALYPAAGITTDWAKGVGGIELSYLFELRGGGDAGFDPPPSEILPIVTETWEGIKVFHKYVEIKFG